MSANINGAVVSRDVSMAAPLGAGGPYTSVANDAPVGSASDTLTLPRTVEIQGATSSAASGGQQYI